MSAIDELTDRVKAAKEQLDSNAWLVQILKDYQSEVEDMNAYEQLFLKGVNASNVDISDYAPYSPITVDIKMAKGQPYDRVTLRDEGDFHRGFTVNYSPSAFSITSTDSKTQKLMSKYGWDIFGLTAANMEALEWLYIYPDIMEKLTITLNGQN